MEILMSHCTNETTDTIMDTMLTTTFWILAKNMNAICILPHEQPKQVIGLRQKLWYDCAQKWNNSNNQFLIDNKSVWHKRQPIQPVFHNNINRFMYFTQQGHAY